MSKPLFIQALPGGLFVLLQAWEIYCRSLLRSLTNKLNFIRKNFFEKRQSCIAYSPYTFKFSRKGVQMLRDTDQKLKLFWQSRKKFCMCECHSSEIWHARGKFFAATPLYNFLEISKQFRKNLRSTRINFLNALLVSNCSIFPWNVFSKQLKLSATFRITWFSEVEPFGSKRTHSIMIGYRRSRHSAQSLRPPRITIAVSAAATLLHAVMPNSLYVT